MLIITGCAEKTHCSAFPEKYLRWMPFQLGDKCTFTDGTHTFQLNVDEVFKTNAYSMKQSLMAHKLCEVEAFVKLTGGTFLSQIKYQSFLVEPDPLGSYNIDTTMAYFYITLLSEQWSAFAFTIKDGQPLNTNPLLNSFNNGYKEYNNVLKLEHDTLNIQDPIYKVYIAESVGIIQFTYRKNNKSWSLISQ
jgi:hypothetical protein